MVPVSRILGVTKAFGKTGRIMNHEMDFSGWVQFKVVGCILKELDRQGLGVGSVVPASFLK